MSNTSWYYGNPAAGYAWISTSATLGLTCRNHRTPFWQAYLDFMAYSVTSKSTVASNCVIQTSSPVRLIDAYKVPIRIDFYASYAAVVQEPAGITEPRSIEAVQERLWSDAAYSNFLYAAYSSFYAYEGLEGCTASVPPSQFYPTYIGMPASTSATALPSAVPADASVTALASANPTTDPVPVRHGRSRQIIIVSIVVPIVGLMILLLCFIIIRRYRKKRNLAAFGNDSATTSNMQLYVDRKAELDAEERRKHELEVGEIRHEMEGEDRVFEMPDDGNIRMGLASSRGLQELRGVEHSQELEVPGNVY